MWLKMCHIKMGTLPNMWVTCNMWTPCNMQTSHWWQVECVLNDVLCTLFCSWFYRVSKKNKTKQYIINILLETMADKKGRCYKMFLWMLEIYHVPFLNFNSPHCMHKMHLKIFSSKTQLCFMSHYYPHSMHMNRY